MSLVTIQNLLDSCVSIGEKSWLENKANEKVLDPFIQNFWLLIEDAISHQVYWDNPPDWDDFNIDWKTPLSIETLKKINNDIEKYSHWDILFWNFHIILETIDEKEIFEEIVRFADEIWIDNFRKFARKNLIAATVEWTPLYELIILIDWWKTMEEAIDIILKKNWINIKVNPRIKINPIIHNYILDFQNHILWLIVKSSWGFWTQSSQTIN